MEWVRMIAATVEGALPLMEKLSAIQGMGFERQSPLHIVHAFATENHLLLGQLATNAKSNEITAIPELLKLLTIN
jgi:hypothetical protein